MRVDRVRGKVEHAGVDRDGNAVSRIRLTNTSPEKVAEMFLTDDPKDFFPSAHAYLRRPTTTGGQEMLENPKMPGPIMHTRIEPDGRGPNGELRVRSTFGGLVTGGSELTIRRDENGDTILDEKTAVRPNYRLPGVGLMIDVAEKVPVMGAFATLGRHMMDELAGAGGRFLAAVHAREVPNGAIRAMEETLTKKNRDR